MILVPVDTVKVGSKQPSNRAYRCCPSLPPFLHTSRPALAPTATPAPWFVRLNPLLSPLTTTQTTMQTQGRTGLGILGDRIKAYGIGSLWWGAWATALSNFVGSFPWFATVSCSRVV